MTIPLDATGFLAEQRLREWDRRYSAPMPNMPAIAKAAMDYTKIILDEYPEAATGGLGVAVNMPDGKTYTVTLTPAIQPPVAPEELLLTHPNEPADTPVSNGFDS
jgi:hypothetical protein